MKNTQDAFSKRRLLDRLSRKPLFLGFVLFMSALSQQALADCTPINPAAGSTVTCDGGTLVGNPYGSDADNLTVNVNPNAQVSPILGLLTPAMVLGGDNVTFNNAGTVDASLLGLLNVLTKGTVIGNANASNHAITNTGELYGTAGVASVTLGDTSGVALDIRNGAGGTTTIINDGIIGARPLVNVNVLTSDAPAIVASGQGNVIMTNNGVVNGRIGFNGASNQLTNNGQITGSVYMGHGSDTFTTDTASTVDGGGAALAIQVSDLLGVGLLNFAASGIVDGGDGFDTLGLKSGTSNGESIASAAQYINFENLVVDSGRWSLVDGRLADTSTLNGGGAVLNDEDNLGDMATAQGGAIEAGVADVNVTTNFTLVNGGLTVQGDNDLTLSGTLSGNGSLTKVDGNTVTLTSPNTYSGGTSLLGGTLDVVSGSLGTGTIAVTTGAIANSGGDLLLDNAVDISGTLTLGGAGAGIGQNETLNGVVAGGGGISKVDGGTATLTGSNTYAGPTVAANDSTIIAGSSTALGTGPLVVGVGGAHLGVTAPVALANNIQLGGDLTVDTTQDTTLSGDISLGGGLVKNGGDTLTLGGTNSYTGGTTINAGTLRGDTDSLQGTFTDDGTVVVDQDGDGVFDGNIDGSGTVTKEGGGTVTVTGPNTYTGGTSINDGAFNVLGADALGTGEINLNGGSLLSDGIGSLINPVAVTAGATIGGAGELTLGGPIIGAGDLDKVGTGAVNLIGDLGAYTGVLRTEDGVLNVDSQFIGSADVRGGTLALTGDTDDSVTVVAPVAGTLAMGGGDDALIVPVGSLTGWVGVADGGAGVDGIYVTETGDGNAPNGGWLNFENLDIGDGASLNVEAGNALDLPGTTTVSQSAGLRLDGSISGDIVDNGSLVGSGSTGGDLTINGLHAPSGVPGGTGVLAGAGVAGSVFNVGGNLTSNATARWIVRVAADGAHDQTNVLGTANLNGGTVVALPADGEYALTNIYPFLTAAGGVNGNFAGVTQDDLPFLTTSLATSPNRVDLVLSRRPTNPNSPDGGGTDPNNPGGGGTDPNNPDDGTGDGSYTAYPDFPNLNGNQGDMATALQQGENAGDANLEPILRQVRGLHANEVIPAFDRLTGESYATSATAINSAGRRGLETVLGHGNTGAEDDTRPANGTVWVIAHGANASQDGDRHAGSAQTTERGGLVGVDFVSDRDVTWGPYLNFGRTHVQATNGRDDHVKATEYGAGLQATYRPGPWFVKGALSYSRIDLNVDRDVRINPSIPGRADSASNGHALRAGVETGWTFRTSDWEVEPMVGAYYGKVRLDAVHEHGIAPARLNVGATSVDETVLGGGARVRHDWHFADGMLQAEFMARYMHSAGNDAASRTMSFAIAPDQTFAVRSAAPGSNWTEVGAGLKYRVGSSTSLFANYQAQVGDGTAHSVNVGLSIDW